MTASANPRAAERNKRLAMDALSCSYVAQSRFINHATQERKNGLRVGVRRWKGSIRKRKSKLFFDFL